MFAVIKTGGKQYRVAADDVLKVEKVKGEPGEIVQFGEVLVVGGDDVTLGAPTVAGASVAAEVLEQGRGAEGHRLQEAPPQEFAPQARPPPGIHPGADHRDPDRRRQADRDARPKPEPKPKPAWRRPTTATSRRERRPEGQGRKEAGTQAGRQEGGQAEIGRQGQEEVMISSQIGLHNGRLKDFKDDHGSQESRRIIAQRPRLQQSAAGLEDFRRRERARRQHHRAPARHQMASRHRMSAWARTTRCSR